MGCTKSMDASHLSEQQFARPDKYLVSGGLSRGVYTRVSGALLLVLQGQVFVSFTMSPLYSLKSEAAQLDKHEVFVPDLEAGKGRIRTKKGIFRSAAERTAFMRSIRPGARHS